MTEEVPAASTMPECNGNVPPEKGPLQVIGEIAKSVGMVPYANAETCPNTPPAKENQQENRNSLLEDVVHGDLDGEKQCQDKPEENGGRLQRGSADTQDAGTDGWEPQEGPGREGTPSGTPSGTAGGGGETGPAASPGGDTAGTLPASADRRGNAAEEEEEEVEEELEEVDTEEDEVQVIELKKEKGEAPRPEQAGSGREPSPPATPGPNCPGEKAGEQPSPGKKNDISRHSYSRYNTISYRRIRKGNTKQRIDEFESMMHL